MTKLAITIDPSIMSADLISTYLASARLLAYSEVYFVLHDDNFYRMKADENTARLLNEIRQAGFRLHAVLDEKTFLEIGFSKNDLKPLLDLGFRALRLEYGFDRHDLVSTLTLNQYGILIEDNALALEDPIGRIKAIQTKGNLKQYSAVHPYYIHPDTGCSFESCFNRTKLFKSCGIEIGVWVNTLENKSPAFPLGIGCPTIENQRHISSNLSASELVALNLFDTLGFGINPPSRIEMEDLTRVVSRNTVEVPVYFHPDLNSKLKEGLLHTTFKARSDSASQLLRAEQFHSVEPIEPFNTVNRDRLSLSIDNNLACVYEGEVQITLKNLPSAPYTNVIGQVDLVAAKLVDLLQIGKMSFVFIEAK
ncbi:MAG: MupG family TIM beta-alpha barrel fold protein [Erysipelotrichaceae bacterium]